VAAIDITQKAGLYETLSNLNTAFSEVIRNLHILQKTGLFRSKAARLFPVLLKSCKPNSTKNFSQTCMILSLRIGQSTAKRGNVGKSTSETLTTFSFTRKNVESNSPNKNSARNPSLIVKSEGLETAPLVSCLYAQKENSKTEGPKSHQENDPQAGRLQPSRCTDCQRSH
jgi:hypothetical protein